MAHVWNNVPPQGLIVCIRCHAVTITEGDEGERSECSGEFDEAVVAQLQHNVRVSLDMLKRISKARAEA